MPYPVRDSNATALLCCGQRETQGNRLESNPGFSPALCRGELPPPPGRQAEAFKSDKEVGKGPEPRDWGAEGR